MQRPGLSRVPGRRRATRARLVAGTLALTMATMGPVTAVAAVPAPGVTTAGRAPTAVTNLTVAVSPAVAKASEVYTVTFKATAAVSSPGAIFFAETAGPTDFSTEADVLVSTQAWHFDASGVSFGPGSGPALPAS